jgi:hypothetical protein
MWKGLVRLMECWSEVRECNLCIEALMRAEDPAVFIRQLKALSEVVPVSDKKAFVKLCGITSAEDAIHGMGCLIMRSC